LTAGLPVFESRKETDNKEEQRQKNQGEEEAVAGSLRAFKSRVFTVNRTKTKKK